MTELEAFRKGKVTFIAVASGMRVVSFLGEICTIRFWLEVVVILKVDGDDSDGLAIDCEGDVANAYEGSTTPWHAFTWALKTGIILKRATDFFCYSYPK